MRGCRRVRGHSGTRFCGAPRPRSGAAEEYGSGGRRGVEGAEGSGEERKAARRRQHAGLGPAGAPDLEALSVVRGGLGSYEKFGTGRMGRLGRERWCRGEAGRGLGAGVAGGWGARSRSGRRQQVARKFCRGKKEKGGDNISPQGKVSVFVCIQWAIVNLIPSRCNGSGSRRRNVPGWCWPFVCTSPGVPRCFPPAFP